MVIYVFMLADEQVFFTCSSIKYNKLFQLPEYSFAQPYTRACG